MQLFVAIAGLVFGIFLVVFAIRVERRPRTSLDHSRVPTTSLMFAGALIAILAAAFLLAINGINLPSRGF